jgi:hypothetical protein
MRLYKHPKIGKLYHIEIPKSSKLVIDDVEYCSHDIFLIVSKPKKRTETIGQKNHTYYGIYAIVNDKKVLIEYYASQQKFFKEIVET